MKGDITIRQIEKNLGIKVHHNELDSSLGRWYESVRDKEVCDFDDEDLCIACRQNLYLDYVVPIAIRRLEGDPLAGKKYDGELIVALRSVPEAYWANHITQAHEVRHVLISIRGSAGSELLSDIDSLLEILPWMSDE